MMNIVDLKHALTPPLESLAQLPPHIIAFSVLMTRDHSDAMEIIIEKIRDEGHASNYGDVACLGFSLGMGDRYTCYREKFLEEVKQLSGRTFFSSGRAHRFEIDGVALLGVAVGLASMETDQAGSAWLVKLLSESEQALKDDELQISLVRAAKIVLGGGEWSSVPDILLRIAVPFALNKEPDSSHKQEAWAISAIIDENDDVVRLSMKRAVFDYCSSILAALPINGASIDELVILLNNISNSMSHWTFETKRRVKGSPERKWYIDHEYHVQNLLWTILRPIFPDLVDEESLPKVGHKSPRYDLGIPSLQTIIEIKFMRKSGQAACAKITEEIAADSALYLTPKTNYKRIIAFIWDDCCQTEEYQTLIQGLESLKEVKRVVILPRPNRMQKE